VGAWLYIKMHGVQAVQSLVSVLTWVDVDLLCIRDHIVAVHFTLPIPSHFKHGSQSPLYLSCPPSVDGSFSAVAADTRLYRRWCRTSVHGYFYYLLLFPGDLAAVVASVDILHVVFSSTAKTFVQNSATESITVNYTRKRHLFNSTVV